MRNTPATHSTPGWPAKRSSHRVITGERGSTTGTGDSFGKTAGESRDGRGEIGDAERVADQIAVGARALRHQVEGLLGARDAALGAGRIDLHVAAHDDANQREDDAIGGRGGRSHRRGEATHRVAAVLQEVVEERETDRTAHLVVEPPRELERLGPRAIRRRVERPLRATPLDVIDDSRRARHEVVTPTQHRHLTLAGELLDHRSMRAGEERSPAMGHALPVQHPAGLLVVVRERELKELRDRRPTVGRRHRSLLPDGTAVRYEIGDRLLFALSN